MTDETPMTNTEQLLKDFPALKPVVDRVETVNGRISVAELSDDGDGLAFFVDFTFHGSGIRYALDTMKDISAFMKVVGVTSLQNLQGAYVRIESMHQASWTPFFRVWHITEPRNFLFKYEEGALARYARGEPV